MTGLSDRYGGHPPSIADHHDYSSGGYAHASRHHRTNDPGAESYGSTGDHQDYVDGGGGRERFYFSSRDHGERSGDLDRHMSDMSYTHANRIHNTKQDLDPFHNDFHLLPRELSIVDNDQDGVSGGDSRVLPYFARDDTSPAK